MVLRGSAIVFSLLALSFANARSDRRAAANGYVGPESCTPCHRSIAETQGKTAMANTWHGSSPKYSGLRFDEGTDRVLRYQVGKDSDLLKFSVASGTGTIAAPVKAMVGGNRHGLSFLLTVNEIDGLPLARPALIEARYALSHKGSLVLSPGFHKDEPADYEDKLGRVLSPTFEARCLSCHGEPHTLGAGDMGGVRCESCHGPASVHLTSVTAGNSVQALVKPENLRGAKSLEVCAQCHSGLTASGHADPLPQDLLVSSQVPALKNSQCFIQSGAEQLNCTSCHNPHADSTTVSDATVNVCLRCHSSSVSPHAAICPVNRTTGCVGCHMPSVDADSFRLTDHWIRVVPGSGVQVTSHDETLRTQIVPKREFLRLIVVENDNQMKTVTDRLAKGESFSKVAHDLSIDPTAPGGGFIGDVALADMDPKLAGAVAHLPNGASSAVISNGNNRMILHRLERDFKWNADRLFRQAQDLDNRGDRAGAIQRDREALDAYPYFLRGLVLMGTMLGQAGDSNRAAQVLQFAVQTYPQDPASQFNLALTLGKQPAAQVDALRRTIELDPDMLAAYQTLGAALYSSGQPGAAIDTFRRGLQVDPLSAVLYYDLGLALKDQGDVAGGNKAIRLADSLDPDIATRKKQ